MRQSLATLWLAGVSLAAGAAVAVAQEPPLPRPRPPQPPIWAEPRSFREAAGPDFKTTEVTSEASDCRRRLEAFATVVPLPRLIGPGACGGSDMVELGAVLLADSTRIAFKPAPVLRCAMAEQLALWIRDDAAPRVSKTGEVLRVVETYDDFSCRGRNRVAGARLSEHGKGNAVDVRAFTFAAAKPVLLTDMTASRELRDGLRESACGRFTTVLGPGSDGYHEGHIHLDLTERRNGYRICQWTVRVPPPPPEPAAAGAQIDGKPVPLPVPRPRMADVPVRGKRKL
jgi:hypothetical protein